MTLHKLAPIVLALTWFLWGQESLAQDKRPSKEQAVQVLKDFHAALQAQDYDKAVTFLQPHPMIKPEALKKDLAEFLKRKEISAKGIEILAAKGTWGKLEEVFEAARARSMAQRFKVSVDSCFGFKLKEAEAAFFWNGEQLKIIRCNDIGQLAPDAKNGEPSENQKPARPKRVVFRLTAEPKEGAFTLLVPHGWIMEGGIYRVDPLKAGGPFNSMWPKCDLTLKSDKVGSVMIRLLPNDSFADFSQPGFEIQRQLFPPGSKFQGGLVRPLPTVENFLQERFRFFHPHAGDVKIVYRELPELAEIVDKVHQPANDWLARLRKPTVRASAGVLLADYREDGVRYKEALLTALVDGRGAGNFWSNSETVLLRAPASEVERWQPVAEVVMQSLKINPDWFTRQLVHLDQVSRMWAEAGAKIREENYQLWQQRQKIMERIDTDWMLYRTGQAHYRNPYTGAIDRDTSAWQHRWVTRLGDVIYSDDHNYNPNSDSSLWTNEWQPTPQTRP